MKSYKTKYEKDGDTINVIYLLFEASYRERFQEKSNGAELVMFWQAWNMLSYLD